MIEEINLSNIKDINNSNQPFDVIGKIIPAFKDDIWTFTEFLYDKPYEKYYPNDDEDNYEDYINNPDKIIYFYYDNNNECIGQIKISKYWNKYAFIEDIAVSKNSRGKKIGTQLINKAIEWAKQKNLCGLMLETQDNNLNACRFYNKLGFKIGAVDIMLYANFENAYEKAVFWYIKF